MPESLHSVCNTNVSDFDADVRTAPISSNGSVVSTGTVHITAGTGGADLGTGEVGESGDWASPQHILVIVFLIPSFLSFSVVLVSCLSALVSCLSARLLFSLLAHLSFYSISLCHLASKG